MSSSQLTFIFFREIETTNQYRTDASPFIHFSGTKWQWISRTKIPSALRGAMHHPPIPEWPGLLNVADWDDFGAGISG
jgi:hypothetical protein